MRRLLAASALAACLAGLPAGAAQAASPSPTTSDAMREGVRDYARLQADHARVSRLHIACGAAPRTNQHAHCSGTFRLTLDGRTSTFTLTSRASVLRLSPSALNYALWARGSAKLPGVPRDIRGFLGFLQ